MLKYSTALTTIIENIDYNKRLQKLRAEYHQAILLYCLPVINPNLLEIITLSLYASEGLQINDLGKVHQLFHDQAQTFNYLFPT